MSDASITNPLAGVTVNIPADNRILSMLLEKDKAPCERCNGENLEFSKNISHTVAALCPITYDLLQRSNEYILEYLEETKGMSLKKFTAQVLTIPLAIAASLYGFAYLDKRAQGSSHAIYAAFEDGTDILRRTPQAVNALTTRVIQMADKQFSEECLANLPIGFPIEQTGPGPLTALFGGISSLFAFGYAGNYWHWKKAGDFVKEIDTKRTAVSKELDTAKSVKEKEIEAKALPSISRDLEKVKLDAEIEQIKALLKSYNYQLSKISEAKKSESWPKACSAASFALASFAAYFGVQNALTYGALASIYFIGIDLFKNGIHSKVSGLSATAANIQERTKKYLTL